MGGRWLWLGGVVAIGLIAGIPATSPADRRVTVGIYQNAPKVFIDDNGNPAGFFPEVLNEIAAREGWQLVYQPCRWEACLAALARGDLDLMMDVAYSGDRARQFDFNTEIVLFSWSIVYAHPTVELESILDLDNRRVAVLRGSVQEAALRQEAQQFGIAPQVIGVSSFEEVFRLIAAGEAEAGIVNRFYGLHTTAHAMVKETPLLFNPAQLYFTTPKGKNTDLLVAIDRQLQEMKASDRSVYAQALNRWLNGPSLVIDRDLAYWLLALGAGAALATVALVTLAWNRTLQQEVRDRRCTEAALRLIEHRFRLFADNSRAVLWIYNPVEGRQIYVSPAFERIWGRPCQVLYENPPAFFDFIHPDDRDRVLQAVEAGDRHGQEMDYTYRIYRPDGEIRWIRDRSFQLRDEAQNIRWLGGIAEDVTVQQQVEVALQERELLFRALFEQARIGIVLTNSSGHITAANPKYCDITGYTAEELQQRHFLELTLPEDRDRNWAEFQRVVTGQQDAFTLEKRYLHKDGGLIWVAVTCATLRNAEGQPQALLVLVDDIRDRKQAETDLRDREQFLRTIYDHAAQGIFIIDVMKDGRFCYVGCNPWHERAMGVSDAACQGASPQDLFSATNAAAVTTRYQECIDAGQAIHYEEMLLLHDRPTWWFTTLSPVKDDTGRTIRIVGTSLDVTTLKQVEAALQDSEAKLRHMTNAIPGAVYQFQRDAAGEMRLLFISDGVEHLYGVTAAAALADVRSLWDLMVPEDLALLLVSVEESARTLEPWILEFRVDTVQGDRKWILGHALPRPQADGSIIWDGILTDISDRKEAELALQDSEARFRKMAANVPGAIFRYVLRPDGTDAVLYMSPGCQKLWEISAESVLTNARPLWEMIHPEDFEKMQASVLESARTLQPWYHTWRIITPSGVTKWLEAAGQPEAGENGEVIWDTLVLDVTDRKRSEAQRARAEAQLAYYALHDSLTGLANRTLLSDRLDLAIQRKKRRPHYQFAVLFLDLDRFKVVNDSLGHLAGDRVLVSVAHTLRSLIRTTDLAARLGGDEFVILLEDITGVAEAIEVAQRILAALQAPVVLGDREVVITTSIGIVPGCADCSSAADLLRNADIAMYRAKARGRDRYELFDSAMHTEVVQRLQLENDLRRAIDRQDLQVYYQPIVSLKTLQLTGFEALIRWPHPTRGLVAPTQFIPIAEETGLILAISEWVLQTACHQLAQWQQQFPHLPPFTISVNLSARDLGNPDLLGQVSRALQVLTPDTGHHLTLEITESMLIQYIADIQRPLAQLKAWGVRVSIDDFGTGYSSLSYLHQLPVDTLKIDGSFVQQMATGDRNPKIVETIVALSDQLGITAIAEGIETPQQLQQLQALGCEYGQGFLFAQALPSTAATEWLTQASQSSS